LWWTFVELFFSQVSWVTVFPTKNTLNTEKADDAYLLTPTPFIIALLYWHNNKSLICAAFADKMIDKIVR